ncbi:MAG: hypothetical protein JNM93_13455 [Bacteriovoracaceae bacterium]|nr:hypothetical protein [Bacteriovoracaceae bacterium]
MKRSCLMIFLFIASCGKMPESQSTADSQALSYEFSLCGIIALSQTVVDGQKVVMNGGLNAFLVLEGQKRINLEISQSASPELVSTIKSLVVPAMGCVYSAQEVKQGYEGEYFLVEAIDLN